MGAWIERPRSLIRYRRRRASGQPPDEPRASRGLERQRGAAIELIREWRAEIHVVADLYDVSAEAIAGVILWDALEDPYRRPVLRLGPGKVHPCELGRKSDARRAEEAGLLPFTVGGPVRRMRLLRRSDAALAYIAAILAYHASNYESIAGVDIRSDPAILCTLYQGGASELRATRLARRRVSDPDAKPVPGDEMGPWVQAQHAFIGALLARPGPTVPDPSVSDPFVFPRALVAALGVGDPEYPGAAMRTTGDTVHG